MLAARFFRRIFHFDGGFAHQFKFQLAHAIDDQRGGGAHGLSRFLFLSQGFDHFDKFELGLFLQFGAGILDVHEERKVGGGLDMREAAGFCLIFPGDGRQFVEYFNVDIRIHVNHGDSS